MALSQTLNLSSNQTRAANRPRYQLKDQTVKNTLLDILTALVIAALLLVGALAYFDVLTK